MSKEPTKEQRNPKADFDLNKVDYEWIEKMTDKKELLGAYNALEIDGYFPDLLKHCGERICQLDPTFRRRFEGEKKLSSEEHKAVNEDLFTFLEGMNQTDSSLRNLAKGADPSNKENNSLFGNQQADAGVKKEQLHELAEKLEKQKIAENERLKGNELIKAKDYKEAVTAYSRSLELNPDEPFTYANRAMAFLKLKNYGNVINDANDALRLKPGYLKAHHRRGKAYAALNSYEKAIKDFQFILEEEPENKDVNRDLLDARRNLNDQLQKESASLDAKPDSKPKDDKKKEAPATKDTKNKFKRVQIEESSDEEEEPRIEEVGSKDTKSAPKIQVVGSKGIDSKFPLTNQKDIDAHSRMAKKMMQQGGDAFMKRMEEQERYFAKSTENKASEELDKLKELEELQKKLEAEVKEKREATKKQAEEARKAQQEHDEALKNKVEAEKELDVAGKAMQGREAELEESLRALGSGEVRDTKPEDTKVEDQKVEEPENTQVTSHNFMGYDDDDEDDQTSAPQVPAKDIAKKEKQKPKVEGVIKKCDDRKAKAAELFKLGQYGDASKQYKGAVDILESAVEDFPLFKEELISVEATIFNNLAACCHKELNSKAEIEYTTKVIERQQYLSDSSVLLKAYLRRGLAYEQQEKYLQAKEDIMSVKQIQADNKQASQCLNRCNKAIKDLYGNKIPDVKKNSPINLSSSSPKKVVEHSSIEPKTVEMVVKSNKKDNEEPKMTIQELEKKLVAIKTEGNKEFGEKIFVMAASKFTEGITLYEKHKDLVDYSKSTLIVVTQLYTNRSLAWHQIGNQADSMKDACYVLDNLDHKNTKALFRRAHGLKLKGDFAGAVKDLENIIVIDPKSAPIAKKELKEIRPKVATATKAAPSSGKPTQKIQEVSSETKTEEPKKELEVEEKTEEVPKKKKGNMTKMLDEETVAQAAARATTKQTEEVLNSIPKTASGLEKDFNQIKKDSNQVYHYLQNIPCETIEKLYKTSEVQSELLSGILLAFGNHGVESKEAATLTLNQMLSFSKAGGFDMTLMFIDDSDKKQISVLTDGFKKLQVDPKLQHRFDQVYGSAI